MFDEPDMWDTAGKVGTNSAVTYSYGPPSHGRAKAERLDKIYIQQLSALTGCSLEDLSGEINDRDDWQESHREIRAGGMTW